MLAQQSWRALRPPAAGPEGAAARACSIMNSQHSSASRGSSRRWPASGPARCAPQQSTSTTSVMVAEGKSVTYLEDSSPMVLAPAPPKARDHLRCGGNARHLRSEAAPVAPGARRQQCIRETCTALLSLWPPQVSGVAPEVVPVHPENRWQELQPRAGDRCGQRGHSARRTL
jgi:hypothetical protein